MGTSGATTATEPLVMGKSFANGVSGTFLSHFQRCANKITRLTKVKMLISIAFELPQNDLTYLVRDVRGRRQVRRIPSKKE